MNWFKPSPPKRLPQDTFLVTGPWGERKITGYVRTISDGILTFLSPDNMIFESFGPGGWWRVVKIKSDEAASPAERSARPRDDPNPHQQGGC